MAEIGQVIAGRYRLMELRGEDAISTVFRATDSENGRVVTVRVLNHELAADADFVAEFRLAMRAAAGLSHPNIVALYDFGASASEAYLVTEFIDGQALGSLLQRNGPVPPRRAANVTSVVATAVAVFMPVVATDVVRWFIEDLDIGGLSTWEAIEAAA